ncbi:MAG: phosphonate C-P lyase system protein PhnL [Betaproteobacteria bacterium]|nr:phosphonate C-P lyase system protein PhnL [Betaproteobacteria bacterium]
MSGVAVRIHELSKTFVLHNQGGAQLAVLANANLNVASGECVVLDGPSGSGKSTLLKCVYATYRATSGSIVLESDEAAVDVTRAPAQSLLNLRRRTIGYVSQFLRVVPRVPALDVVAEALIEDAGEDDRLLREARVEAQHLLLRLRIPQRLWNVPPATFSGGEQQRINVARSLIKPRPVLLLDEPTASLDARNRQTVVCMIREARARGAAILGIFHDAAVRDAVATRVIDMTEMR